MSGPRRRKFVGPLVSRVTWHGGRGTPYLRRWALIIALAAKLEALVPGGLGARAHRGDADVQDVGLARRDGVDASPERGLQILGLADLAALAPLRLRENHEVDLRLAEVDLGVFLLLGHLSAEGVEVGAHRLVVQVVPDDGQDRQAIAGHRPEAGGAVHHGAVAYAS